MIDYLTHNQIVKFISPQPILKQAEVEQEYICDVSSPTVINLPSILNRSSSDSGSLIDIGDIAGGLVGAGISASLTGLLG